MTHTKMLSRRSVTTGLAAAVTAIPAVGLAGAASIHPLERIRRLTLELEEAMLAAYGGQAKTCSWGPHNPAEADASSPVFFIVVHPKQAT